VIFYGNRPLKFIVVGDAGKEALPAPVIHHWIGLDWLSSVSVSIGEINVFDEIQVLDQVL